MHLQWILLSCQSDTQTHQNLLQLSKINAYCISKINIKAHLDGSVVCPHFILDPVFLKDVHRLQKCEPLDVPRWFEPATEPVVTACGQTTECVIGV